MTWPAGEILQVFYFGRKNKLREEEAIQKEIDDGINYVAGAITVIELVEKYIALKDGVRYNTKVGYNYVLNLIKKEDFGYRIIREKSRPTYTAIRSVRIW